MPESARGDQAKRREPLLQQSVGRDGGAVIDAGRMSMAIPKNLANAFQEPARGIIRSARSLGGEYVTSLLVDSDDIGEGAAGVDSNAEGRGRAMSCESRIMNRVTRNILGGLQTRAIPFALFFHGTFLPH